MIIVNFENTVMWSEMFSEMYLLVQNTGPEKLYCGEEFEKQNAEGEYIHISRMKFVPAVGTDQAAFVNQQDGVSFTIVQQPSNEGRRVREWTCDYESGIMELKPKESLAVLESGQFLRIQVCVKEKAAQPGWGNMTYQFCGWESSNMSVTLEEIKKNREEQGLRIQKLPVPVIEQFAPDEEYQYQKYAAVHWKISGSESIMGCRLQIDGKEYENIAEGSTELLMENDKHVLELRELHNLSLVKNFWPRWFLILEQEQPEKKVPEKEGCVRLWWNIPEAKTCFFGGKEMQAGDTSMEYSDWNTALELTYYDETRNKQSLKIDYKPPKITAFNKKASDFIPVEQLKEAEPVVNSVYGGNEPDTPLPPPPPKKETLILNCACAKGPCYYKINGGSIGTILPENQGADCEVRVNKAAQYQIRLWDMYGCMLTQTC